MGGCAFECFAADVAEGKLDGSAAGQRDGGDAGELADGFFFCGEDGAGFGAGAFELEGGEGAVDVAAGADALDDLLAEVATLGEVEGSSLVGLLGEFLVADVDAEAGCAFEDAEVFEGFVFDGDCACGSEGLREGGDGFGGFGPELVAGDARAMGVEDGDLMAAPVVDCGEVQGREVGSGDADGCQGCGGLGAGDKEAEAGVFGEFDVVHDDVAVEELDERGDAGAIGCEEDAGLEHEGDGVGLDAALDGEKEVVVALAGFEVLDGVGGHAVEPADAVVAGDANPSGGGEGSDGGVVEEGFELRDG